MKSLNLKIELDEKSGFCFGVIGAINKAEAELDRSTELYCLGEIVHNDEEIKRLEQKGLITIDRSRFNELKNKIIMFRAHGEPPASYKQANDNNNKIIDASCPIILRMHKQISESYNNNENIYIYGKPNHPEVIGLNGQIDNKAFIFDNITELKIDSIPVNITLFSQTTMSLGEFRKIVSFLESSGIKVKVKDTICRQVSNREPYLKEFSSRFDKIIFVAGRDSSNGKVLFNVCKSQNPNSYFISNTKEINKDWFSAEEKVGICGATSTPMWLMKAVEDTLKSF